MKAKTNLENNLNTAIQKLQQIKTEIYNQPILQYELEQIIKNNTVKEATRLILQRYTLIENEGDK